MGESLNQNSTIPSYLTETAELALKTPQDQFEVIGDMTPEDVENAYVAVCRMEKMPGVWNEIQIKLGGDSSVNLAAEMQSLKARLKAAVRSKYQPGEEAVAEARITELEKNS